MALNEDALFYSMNEASYPSAEMDIHKRFGDDCGLYRPTSAEELNELGGFLGSYGFGTRYWIDLSLDEPEPWLPWAPGQPSGGFPISPIYRAVLDYGGPDNISVRVAPLSQNYRYFTFIPEDQT
ncbi:hypothetical protein [Streptomyces sp. NPDC051546]|uniref:hypothetical protein n=1 Tax=Streptomyces sp. NPDC051546 TaxID=3365655 RepID=UPI00378A397E